LWITAQILGIVDAIALLHKENIRHGDIKPENILCFQSTTDSTMNLVLADFGLGRLHNLPTQLRGQHTVTMAFTIAYRAPESDMYGEVRSRAYDIWGLGCLFLEMAGWILGRLDELQRIRRKGGVEEAFFDVDTADQFLAYPGRMHDRQGLFSIKPEVTRVSEVLRSYRSSVTQRIC
jgi:serine/threonine protein kinase